MSALHADIKWCSAASYAEPDVTTVLGSSLHPGGLDFTRELLQQCPVTAGTTVLDIACGRGDSALLAATEFAADVVGVDLAERNIAAAYDVAEKSAITNPPGFLCADAEDLPFPDCSYHYGLAECALGALPDQRRALAELFRVLEPGGGALIHDFDVQHDLLPAELTAELGLAATISGARTLNEYAQMCTAVGFDVVQTGQLTSVLHEAVGAVGARLAVLGLPLARGVASEKVDLRRCQELLWVAKFAIAKQVIDYGYVQVRKPQ